MSELLTFNPDEPGVFFNLDRLIASRLLIQANSGGGKSRALRYILEQTYGQVQQIVFDWEGEFDSLREKFDYLLVGDPEDGADIPANLKAARPLAKRVMELGVSVVIDLYGLKLEERREYVRLFVESLMTLPKTLWRPLLVVIDEGHMVCPEGKAANTAAKDAVIALASQGRKRGFALCIATQRLSKLDKDCAAELINKMIGRTGLDVDMTRAGDELGMAKAERLVLRDLEPGTFFVFGPAIGRGGVTTVHTGEIQTTHPEPGMAAPPVPPPTAKIAGLLGKLEDLDAEAAREAKNLEDARREIKRLETELRRTKRAPSADELNQAVQTKTEELQGEIERLRDQLSARPTSTEIAHEVQLAVAPLEERNAHLERIIVEFRDLNDEMQALHERCRSLLSFEKHIGIMEASERSHEIPADLRVQTPAPVPQRIIPPKKETPAFDPSAGVSKAQQKVLNACAWWESIIGAATKLQVAFVAGYTPNSGGYNNLLGSLRSAGLIEYPTPGMVRLTAEGMRVASTTADDASTLDEFHDMVRSKLSGPQQKLLNVAIANYPSSIPKGFLASESGYTANSGGFNNLCGSLRSLGLIDYPSPGNVVCTDVLFPEGLR